MCAHGEEKADTFQLAGLKVQEEAVHETPRVEASKEERPGEAIAPEGTTDKALLRRLRRACLRVHEELGAGIGVRFELGVGYVLDSIAESPGQPDLQSGDIIVAVAGRSVAVAAEDDADEILAGELADGVELLLADGQSGDLACEDVVNIQGNGTLTAPCPGDILRSDLAAGPLEDAGQLAAEEDLTVGRNSSGQTGSEERAADAWAAPDPCVFPASHSFNSDGEEDEEIVMRRPELGRLEGTGHTSEGASEASWRTGEDTQSAQLEGPSCKAYPLQEEQEGKADTEVDAIQLAAAPETGVDAELVPLPQMHGFLDRRMLKAQKEGSDCRGEPPLPACHMGEVGTEDKASALESHLDLNIAGRSETSDGSRLSPPMGCKVADLREWLLQLSLEEYEAAAVKWCSEMGAVSLEEIAENIDDFADGVALKPIERQRVQKWSRSLTSSWQPQLALEPPREYQEAPCDRPAFASSPEIEIYTTRSVRLAKDSKGTTGLDLCYAEQGVIVERIAPLPGQPGLHAGDCIVAVDGQPLRHRSAEDLDFLLAHASNGAVLSVVAPVGTRRSTSWGNAATSNAAYRQSAAMLAESLPGPEDEWRTSGSDRGLPWLPPQGPQGLAGMSRPQQAQGWGRGRGRRGGYDAGRMWSRFRGPPW
mmetsp:Transcript_9503/g.21112  ORF Transcript_9503/g.21112 Transcript_9503/m.21112 type:complete len:650 (+) Transcript_9503:86-2035(+)